MDVSSKTFSVGKVTNKGKVEKQIQTQTACMQFVCAFCFGIPIKIVLGEI